jgi:hypothetical protein
MLFAVSPERASAQNLFEVQVFPDEVAERGETGIEFHNVIMPSGTRVGDMFDPSVARGDARLDQLVRDGIVCRDVAGGHAAFTGWHVRPKVRLAEWKPFPFHVSLSLSLEYAFIKQPGDAQFRQARRRAILTSR